jgi:ATPase subunit of ABC transporter with duplicated ATPase domains
MMGGRQVNSRAYLSRFNLEEAIKKKVSTLSGGERNRLHLAMTLKKKETYCCSMSLPMIYTYVL